MTPATTAGRRRRGRAIAIGLLAGAVTAALAVGAAAFLAGDTSRQRARSHAGLEACVARWNGPSNSGARAIMNRAGLAAGVTPAVERHVLVLRYAGPPLEDVGVGEPGVNASRGQCLVAHATNVLYLYSRGAWHQAGYSPGLAFDGIPQRAARAPNAALTLQPPGERPNGEAGTVRLTR